MGVNSDIIDYSNDSIIEKALYNPSNDSTLSYYNLGTYSQTEFCFIEPDACPQGVSIALWLKIVELAGHWQGILTTTKR